MYEKIEYTEYAACPYGGGPVPTFRGIPKLTRDGNYRVDVPWGYLERTLTGYTRDYGLILDPDFQRGHVWGEPRQRAFVEFVLRNGHGSNELRFNCPGWQAGEVGDMVIVDGKQRLEAVRKFLRDELPILDGRTYSMFGGYLPLNASFSIRINDLPTRADVLRWYLEINTGGVAHTRKELTRVQELLRTEEAK